MAKVEIKPHGGCTDILVNGTALNNVVSYAIHQQVGMEVPVVEIKLYGHKNEYLFEDADVHVNIMGDSLQSATTIIRNELLKQGDLYNGFIASIGSSLRESGVYEPDIDDMSRRVLNRIIGLEDDHGSN